MKIDAVVLAARPNTGRLATESDEVFEANIDIAGQPMLSYVLSVLEPFPEMGEIILVGPEEGLSHYERGKIRIIRPGSELIENVKIGLGRANTKYVLVATSDIPLLTGDALRGFLEGALGTGAEFAYAVTTREDCINKYPGVQRTYAKLKGVTLTGGNLFLVEKNTIDEAWPVIEKLIGYRKSPLKMASVFGVGFLARVFLGFAGVQEVEEYVSALLGIKCRAVLSAPEISFDVDKPEDLRLVRDILGKCYNTLGEI